MWKLKKWQITAIKSPPLIQPRPKGHNICSKSPQYDPCNSGQLTQCINLRNKQTNGRIKQTRQMTPCSDDILRSAGNFFRIWLSQCLRVTIFASSPSPSLRKHLRSVPSSARRHFPAKPCFRYICYLARACHTNTIAVTLSACKHQVLYTHPHPEISNSPTRPPTFISGWG